MSFYTIANQFISTIEFNHYLPSFEFYPHGFLSRDTTTIMPYQLCIKQLENSLLCIKNLYAENGLEIIPKLTSAFFDEDAFQLKKEKYYQKIVEEKITNSQLNDFLDNLFKKRNGLYQSIHPKNFDESNDDYTKRLKTILEHQVAEYYSTGDILTSEPLSFGLVSDSPHMSETYGFNKQPILCGKDARVSGYFGE